MRGEASQSGGSSRQVGQGHYAVARPCTTNIFGNYLRASELFYWDAWSAAGCVGCFGVWFWCAVFGVWAVFVALLIVFCDDENSNLNRFWWFICGINELRDSPTQGLTSPVTSTIRIAPNNG